VVIGVRVTRLRLLDLCSADVKQKRCV
jgi:hypothetical protein